MIYVVDLKNDVEVTIGRNLENLMIINELSVSRKHCKLLVNRGKRELLLLDNRAKFGTTVEMGKL